MYFCDPININFLSETLKYATFCRKTAFVANDEKSEHTLKKKSIWIKPGSEEAPQNVLPWAEDGFWCDFTQFFGG